MPLLGGFGPDVEELADLAVREAIEVAQEDHLAVRLGELREGDTDPSG
jgi:hypothetical protein